MGQTANKQIFSSTQAAGNNKPVGLSDQNGRFGGV